MMALLEALVSDLRRRGADIVRFVDISALPTDKRRGYRSAVLIAAVLSRAYVQSLVEGETDTSEFSKQEAKTDSLAEQAADFLRVSGNEAFPQSEKNLIENSGYDERTKTTILPHKTIAVMAGLGWIGKNNLLTTEQYGSALSMCTVLTNLPMPAENGPRIAPQCGNCTVCSKVCPEKAIWGTAWSVDTARDNIVDVYHCTACLKCMVNCPWTLHYAKEAEL